MDSLRDSMAAEQSLPPTPPSELHSMKQSSTPPPIVHTHETIPHIRSTTITNANTLVDPSLVRHIWIVTGPAGCGKTSVADYLSQQKSWPYLEGDAFHPEANIKKMSAGQPLTDADRWDWLIELREQAIQAIKEGASGVFVTCSALKRKYRDVMRIATYHHPAIHVHFIFLAASEALLMQRVTGRAGHYMKNDMVRSQFESLEVPQADERDVLSVDASASSEAVQQLSLEVVRMVTP